MSKGKYSSNEWTDNLNIEWKPLEILEPKSITITETKNLLANFNSRMKMEEQSVNLQINQ